MEALLRRIVPPEYVQTQAERNVRALMAYFRGDTDDLVLGVEVGPVLENVRPVVVDYVAKRVQSAELLPTDSYAAYTARLTEIVDGLKSGQIPDSLPTYTFTEEERAAARAVILANTTVTEPERAAVADALAAGDTAGAVTAALDPLIRQRTEESLAGLRKDLAPGDVLDFVDKAASDQDETKVELLSNMQPARHAVREFDTWGVPLAVGVVALVTVLLGVLYLPSRDRAFAVAGAGLLLVGVLTGAGWLVFRDMAPDRAHDAMDDGAGAERALGADVVRSLLADSSSSAWQPIAAVLLAGVILEGVAWGPRVAGRRAAPVGVSAEDEPVGEGAPPPVNEGGEV